MMVKILREGADLGGVRRQRGVEKSTPSWERSVSERVGGFSGWERLSQWDPPGGGGSFVGSAQASFREPSQRSERRTRKEEKRWHSAMHTDPWVKSKIW